MPALLPSSPSSTPLPPLPPLPPIAVGATIGIIAPAGPAARERVDAITPWLASRGFDARLFPSCHAQDRYLAGSDALRAIDLHAAFVDPGVAAIICLRGGYGSARLLGQIDYALVREHAKPFVGYSDITSLHVAFNQFAHLPTLHAPMMASDFVVNQDEASADALFALLTGGVRAGLSLAPADRPLHTLVGGTARGRLTGGNLCVLAASLGTPYALDARDSILFLEEVGEAPYKVDRMLTQLRHAGVLDAARGFVIGSFSDADDAQDVIADTLAPFGKPVLCGFPAGHCVPNFPLPLGAEVILDADARRLTVA